jgi:hypothetical protein
VDVHKILAALRQEHTHIEAVIANLECLAQSRERRHGKPAAIFAAARKRGRPRGSKNKALPARLDSQSVSVTPRPARVMAAGQSAMPEEPSASVI